MDLCRECTLFNGTSTATVDRILSRYRVNPVRYSEGSTVSLSGENYEKLILINEGSIAAEMRGFGGKVLRIETLHRGSAIAAAVLFSSEPVLPVCLTALEDCSVFIIPRNAILDLCSADRNFLENYLKDMGDKVQFLAEKIRLFQFSTIRQKLIAHLMSTRAKFRRDTFRLSFSREVLAEIMGVARPSLSREFSALTSEGLIEISGRNVKILEPEALAEEAASNG